MGFTQRFAETPKLPALDINELLVLVNNPQKAAELWAKYVEAHNAYEVEMAEIKRFTAEIEKAQKVLWQDNFDLEEEQKKHEQAVAELNKEKARVGEFERFVRALEENNKKEFDKQTETLKAWEDRVNKRDNDLLTSRKAFEKAQMDWTHEVTGRENMLAEREVAVAEREAKAEKLAKLLKEF